MDVRTNGTDAMYYLHTDHLGSINSIYNASGIAGNSDGQLTPDRVLADAGNLTTAASATPIPPVVSGIVVLEEFKPRNTVELKSLAVAHV